MRTTVGPMQQCDMYLGARSSLHKTAYSGKNCEQCLQSQTETDVLLTRNCFSRQGLQKWCPHGVESGSFSVLLHSLHENSLSAFSCSETCKMYTLVACQSRSHVYRIWWSQSCAFKAWSVVSWYALMHLWLLMHAKTWLIFSISCPIRLVRNWSILAHNFVNPCTCPRRVSETQHLTPDITAQIWKSGSFLQV